MHLIHKWDSPWYAYNHIEWRDVGSVDWYTRFMQRCSVCDKPRVKRIDGRHPLEERP